MAPDNHTWTYLIRQIRKDLSPEPGFIIARLSAEKSAKTLPESRAGFFNTTNLVNCLNLFENDNRYLSNF